MRYFLAISALLMAGAAPNASAITFNFIYDSTITSRTDAMQLESAFVEAGQALSSVIDTPITFNINATLVNDSSNKYAAYATPWGYYWDSGTVIHDLQTTLYHNGANGAAISLPDATAFSSMLSTSSFPGNFYVPAPLAQAIGLLNAQTPDEFNGGSIAVNTYYKYTDTQQGPIASGTLDLVGTLTHEITHLMGRASFVSADQPDIWPTPFDLFRYTAPGQLAFTYSGPPKSAYFSVDGGVTNLGYFDMLSDTGDFACNSSGQTDSNSMAPAGYCPNDPFGYSVYGKKQLLSELDLETLVALGYDVTSSVNVTPVPEPENYAMLLAGLGLLGFVARRRA